MKDYKLENKAKKNKIKKIKEEARKRLTLRRKKLTLKERVVSFGKNVLSNAKKTIVVFSALFISSGPVSSQPKNTDKGNGDGAKIETLTPTVKTIEVDESTIAKYLVEQGENTIENFDIDDYKFTREELQMMTASEDASKIVNAAKKISKKGRPAAGQQTYCLRGVRSIYAKAGIDLDAHKYAYNAIDGFRKNENFVELNCDRKDYPYLVEGTGLVWNKGKTGRYGHVGIVGPGIGGTNAPKKQFCDYIYSISEKDKVNKYGSSHVFVLKSTKLDEKLVVKLIDEGKLKSELKNEILAELSEQNPNTTYVLTASLTEEESKQNNINALSVQDIMVKEVKKTELSHLRNKLASYKAASTGNKQDVIVRKEDDYETTEEYSEKMKKEGYYTPTKSKNLEAKKKEWLRQAAIKRNKDINS